MAEAPLRLNDFAAASKDHRGSFDHLFEALHGNWRASEAYVHGRLALRFDYWSRAGDRDGGVKHRVVVFQRAPGVDRDLPCWTQDILEAEEVDFKKLRIAVNGTDTRDEGAVFVLVGKPPKRGERVARWVAIKSVVWLAELDEPEGIGADSSDIPLPLFSLAIARVLRRLLVEQWEGMALGLLPVGDNKLPHQMVKDTAQVVDEIADKDAPPHWRLASDLDAAEEARGLYVYLGHDPVGVGFVREEQVNIRPERIKMEFCAL